MSLPDPYDDPHFYDHLVAKRFLAWVIDLVVTLVLVLVVVAATALIALVVLPLVWAAIAVAYRYVMLSRYGATLGMMVAATRLRRLDGTRADPALCLWHALLYAGTMMFVFPQIASVALVLTTPYKQALNDWLLGTTLINRYRDD